jgi:hypothetical protein
MDHAALVGMAERSRDLDSVADDGFCRQPVGRDDLRERMPSTNSIAMNARP